MVKKLLEKNYIPIIYDDFSKGHIEVIEKLKKVDNGLKYIKGDLGDRKKLKEIFDSEKIDAVMHFAAFIEVGESVKNPSKYYENNVVKVKNLLDQMVESKVNNFIFSSTAAVFGEPTEERIDEKHSKYPINPYGDSKLMVEKLLRDYEKAYGLKHTILRYFNACGADDTGEIGESHNPETHLIPLILKAAKGERENIKIFGTNYPTKDGSCIRDFIHVNDLAEAHIRALENLWNTKESKDFNLGSGNGYSVKEVIEMAKNITQINFNVVEEKRREGDPSVLVADSKKAREILKWEPKYTLEKIIETAWNWEKNKSY
jgi:UDP-glucose 4-epimerase